MAKPRFPRSGLGFIMLTWIGMFSATVTHAQQSSYSGAPYGPDGEYGSPRDGYAPPNYYGQFPYGVSPTVIDPALLAAYYNVDPSLIPGATLAYDTSYPPGVDYQIDMAAYQQTQQQPAGFMVGGAPMQQQPNWMGAGAYSGQYAGPNPYGNPNSQGYNPYATASFQDDPMSPNGMSGQPNALPSVGYSGNQFNVTANANAGNPAGRFTFSPQTPSWLKGFQTGMYANYDQVVFSAGGIVSLFESPMGAVATRMLATAAIHSAGDTEAGFSVDMWAARRLRILGYEHYVKLGGFYDRQHRLQRAGIATGGILFTNLADIPPTFDIAVGIGDGSDVMSGTLRQVADVDVQMRFGFLFSRFFRAGVNMQFWHWDNPQFDESVWAAGGYAAMDLGRSMLTADISFSDNQVQGFLNLVFQPGAVLPHHPQGSMNVTTSETQDQYTAWFTQPVIRDISFRTGQSTNRFGGFLGNLTAVRCAPVLIPGTLGGGDVNDNGIIDPGDTFSVQIVFQNGSSKTATGVGYTGPGGAVPVNVIGNATETFGTSFGPVSIAPGGTVVATGVDAVTLTANASAAVGDQIFIEFQVNSDGVCGRFRCGPVTVGAAPPAAMDAQFLGLCF